MNSIWDFVYEKVRVTTLVGANLISLGSQLILCLLFDSLRFDPPWSQIFSPYLSPTDHFFKFKNKTYTKYVLILLWINLWASIQFFDHP